jgi:hypothetical protein
MQFMAKPKPAVDIHISYKADVINNTCSTNFLGLNLDSTWTWKTHIKQLSSKLNSACYLIKWLRSVICMKNLRTIYFSYVQSIIMYGTIFGGSSPFSTVCLYLKNTYLQFHSVRFSMRCMRRWQSLGFYNGNESPLASSTIFLPLASIRDYVILCPLERICKLHTTFHSFVAC